VPPAPPPAAAPEPPPPATAALPRSELAAAALAAPPRAAASPPRAATSAGDEAELAALLSRPQRYSQFRAEVPRWEGLPAAEAADADALVRAQRPAFKRRVGDSWDADYDRGRAKKRRAPAAQAEEGQENPFEARRAARAGRGPHRERGGAKRGGGALRREAAAGGGRRGGRGSGGGGRGKRR